MSLLAAMLMASTAHASIDPKCVGETQKFDEQGQQDFLLNYFALAVTLSPLHAPVPLEPGHGSLGLELNVIPPLNCSQRLVLNSSKTEDTNKAPVAPRPRLMFALPKLGPVVPYGSIGYVPPVTVFGTRNVIVSGEIGVGVPLDNGLQLGGRYHATLMKTIAEIATPFVDGDPAYDDFYSGSTFGVDLMAGYETAKVTPYLAVGFTDVSTFFLIGDDLYVGDNTTPYFGPTASLGAQTVLKEHFDLAAEFYTAPRYIYTGRLRLAYTW